jgi:uncharacterized protein
MKKLVLILITMFTVMMQAQEFKQIPLVNVSGEGKIKTAPDQALISVSIETKGTVSATVKKENDTKMDAILKFIKKSNIAKEDYQTQCVSLNPNYDYEKKKHNYIANQTVSILLKDITNYDVIMDGLVDTGINRIDGVEFKSSKMLQLQSNARKLAVKDAKAKAEDYVSGLGQKIGKAFTITDNNQNFSSQPQASYSMKAMQMSDDGIPRETLAVGEIEVVVNVTVSFVLD